MPPIYKDKLSIKYGGLEVGANTDRRLDGWHHVSKSFDRSEVQFTFIISKDTEEAFAAECQSIEAAARKPFKNLVVMNGTAVLLSLSHSSNTALNAQPRIDKGGDPADTGLSRVYTIAVEYDMPADNAPTTGLRESTISVRYDTSRIRTVDISGVWTAIGGSSARTHYDANADAYCSTVLAALGGTYNETQVDESADADYEDKHVTFSRTYSEIIFGQGADSPLDDAGIMSQVLTIRRMTSAPGDTPGDATRLVELDVNYSASIDKDVTTDLVTKYASIRTWLISHVSSTLEGATLAVTEESPEYNFDQNRISVRMHFRGVDGGDLLEEVLSVEDTEDAGVERARIWSGKPFDRYRYQGHAELRRTITQRLLVTGVYDARGAAKWRVSDKSRPFSEVGAGGGRWDYDGRSIKANPVRLGQTGDNFIDATNIEIRTEYVWFTTPSGGGMHSVAVPSGQGGGAGGEGRAAPTPSGGASG